MRPPCEKLSRSFLKEIRRTVAISLVNTTRMSQPQVAKILKVSQPVVHDYLRTKSPAKSSNYDKTIQSTANQILKQIKDNTGPEQIIRTLCSACHSLRLLGPFCHYHRESLSDLSTTCSACLPSISEKEILGKAEIIDELNQASEILLNLHNIHTIVPQIGMQIAFALKEAKGNEDIATLPGRLIKVKTKVVKMAAPEFGISKTSSQILLERMKTKPTERTVICIRNTDEIRAAFRKMNTIVIETQGADQNWDGTLTQLAETNHLAQLNVLADLGSPGFESVAYFFGERPLTMIKHIENLLNLI